MANEIITSFELAAAELVLALHSDTVDTSHRTAIQEAVGTDLGTMMYVTGLLLTEYEGRYQAGKATEKKALLGIKAEYKAMGFNELLDYKYLEQAVKLYLLRKTILGTDGETAPETARTDAFEQLQAIYKANADCPVQQVADAVNMLCLRLLSRCGLVGQDLDFTGQLMTSLREITEERKEAALLPSVLLAGL